MEFTKESKTLLNTYIEEVLAKKLENEKKSYILQKFSEIFPNIPSTIQSQKIELMNLWLNAHVDQYFTQVEKYNPNDWKNNATVHIPIHGDVHLKPEIQYLLNIPIVRRCNAIKQLSTAYTIYPGAKHTRYEHQLGTLFIVQKFCEHLIKEKAISKNDQITLEVAALIHDVAHPPLGHSLDNIKEILIPTNKDSVSFSYDRKIDKTLLEIYLTDENYQLKLAIESIDAVNIDLLNSVLFNKSNPSDEFPAAYGDLLDSEIDADRLDYLPRDGVHTGKNKSIDLIRIVEHSHFCELRDDGKTRTSLAFSEDISDDLNLFLVERKNMYKQVYENEDKVILDEVIVHGIYCMLKLHYGVAKNDLTRKFLLLTDCELNGFLELFSPSIIFNQINSQLNGKPSYSIISKYNLQEKSNPNFYIALKEAVTRYAKLYGFQYKLDDEIEFSENIGIKAENSGLGIPPIIFSLPHYIPSDDNTNENYEREGKRKRGLKELVLRKSDGSCGYYTDLSNIQKEKDPSLNKFLLIGKNELVQNNIPNDFEKFITSKYLPSTTS